jgi:DNA polymerase/3'-5' exonuclease PolX
MANKKTKKSKASKRPKAPPAPIDPAAEVDANTPIVAMLLATAMGYEGGGGLSRFKVRALRNAARQVKTLDWAIQEVHGEKLAAAGDEPVKVKGVGVGCAKYIKEFLLKQ